MRFTIIQNPIILPIVQDTREQLPWEFSDRVDVEIATLREGDYSLKGYENRVAIARKSLSDFMSSITTDRKEKGTPKDHQRRERFKRELRRLQPYELKVLIIEGSWQEIISGNYRSQVHPASAIGTIVSFVWKYGIIPVLADTREIAALIAETILRQYAEDIEKRHKTLMKAHKEERP